MLKIIKFRLTTLFKWDILIIEPYGGETGNTFHAPYPFLDCSNLNGWK